MAHLENWEDNALKILAKYHTKGNGHEFLIQWECAGIRDTLALDKANYQGSTFFNYWEFMRALGNRLISSS